MSNKPQVLLHGLHLVIAGVALRCLREPLPGRVSHDARRGADQGLWGRAGLLLLLEAGLLLLLLHASLLLKLLHAGLLLLLLLLLARVPAAGTEATVATEP